MVTRVFECQCGQIARSKFEYDRHPRSKDCAPGVRTPVKSELEVKPEEPVDRDPSTTKYPRIDPREVWK